MEVELAEQLARASERQGEDLMEEDPNQALVLEQSEVLKDASEAASAAQRCIPLFACFHRLLQQPHDDPHLGIEFYPEFRMLSKGGHVLLDCHGMIRTAPSKSQKATLYRN